MLYAFLLLTIYHSHSSCPRLVVYRQQMIQNNEKDRNIRRCLVSLLNCLIFLPKKHRGFLKINWSGTEKWISNTLSDPIPYFLVSTFWVVIYSRQTIEKNERNTHMKIEVNYINSVLKCVHLYRFVKIIC